MRSLNSGLIQGLYRRACKPLFQRRSHKANGNRKISGQLELSSNFDERDETSFVQPQQQQQHLSSSLLASRGYSPSVIWKCVLNLMIRYDTIASVQRSLNQTLYNLTLPHAGTHGVKPCRRRQQGTFATSNWRRRHCSKGYRAAGISDLKSYSLKTAVLRHSPQSPTFGENTPVVSRFITLLNKRWKQYLHENLVKKNYTNKAIFLCWKQYAILTETSGLLLNSAQIATIARCAIYSTFII